MTPDVPPSQTLSRGLTLLEVLAETETALSVAELASAASLHRSVAYRLLRTLECHRLVTRAENGGFRLGPGLAALARGVSRDLQTAALPELTGVAGELGMTAFVAVLDQDEVVTLTSVEPAGAHAAIAQRPGSRHSVRLGAPGIAIQAGLPEHDTRFGAGRRKEVLRARSDGFAVTRDEIIPGLSSVAVPLHAPGHPPAALAVVYLSTGMGHGDIAGRLSAAAERICRALG